VIGIGNRFRRDDSVGLQVLDAVEPRLPGCVDAVESNGDAFAMVTTWDGADQAVLVDAVSSGGKPGTIYRFDGAHRLPAKFFRAASSHTLGLGEALELARTLGRLPPKVTVVGIEAGDFAQGEALSDPVEAALPRAAELVLQLLEPLHPPEAATETGVSRA
jgi:hydrogenase maturation protease